MVNDAPAIGAAAELDYLTEGSANIVYRFVGEDKRLVGKLVRLRKNLLTTPSTLAQMEYINCRIKPLLGDLVLPCALVSVSFDVLHALNERLRQSATRHKKSSLLLDAHEPYGVSMINLCAAVEFKPKWIVQSRSAPVDWTTCRTCALRLMRKQEESFCPLLFMTKHAQYALHQIHDKDWFVESVLHSGVLMKLATLQQKMDPYGPLQVADGDTDFPVAMTLRDCSVYVTPSKVFVADLDVKGWDGGKGVYWRNTETALINGDFYHRGGCRELRALPTKRQTL